MPSGGGHGGTGAHRRELDVKGFEGIETFHGGEEAWRIWNWKGKVAIKAMAPELMKVMSMAEKDPKRGARSLMGRDDVDDELSDDEATRKVVKASGELYSFLVRYTGGEAATVVREAGEMDGVEAYGRLHENYNKRTIGRMFRVQRENMYPKAAKDVNGVKVAILEWGEKWKRMLT